MKIFLLVIVACLALSCKKENAAHISEFNWLLQSATVNPALTIDGKTFTNFKTSAGPSSCLNNNFTLIFNDNGSYAFTSTGALCDMISYQDAKWTREGNKITLNAGVGTAPQVCTFENNTISYKEEFVKEGTTYTVTYIYSPKSK